MNHNPTTPAINPLHARVGFAEAKSRTSGGDAISELTKEFATRESRARFQEWKNNSVTKQFLAALRAMAIHQPPMAQQTDIVAQYGVTTGLMLAAQFLEDPASMLPVFQEISEDADPLPAGEVREEYTTPGV